MQYVICNIAVVSTPVRGVMQSNPLVPDLHLRLRLRLCLRLRLPCTCPAAAPMQGAEVLARKANSTSKSASERGSA